MPAQAQLSLGETNPAPITYTVPNAQSIGLLCANANFDGSGSATPYLPALEIVSDSGHIVSRTIGQQVAAGGSAEVTFAPFLSAPPGDPTAVHFNVGPQPGTFLQVDTTGNVTLNAGGGIFLTATGAAGLFVDQEGSGGLTIVNAGTGHIDVVNNGGGDTIIETIGAGRVRIRNMQDAAAGGAVPPAPNGFFVFGKGPNPSTAVFVPFWNATF